MGDWNPRAPDPIGSETRIGGSRALILDNPSQAYAGRIKVASADTITALHTWLQSFGPNPGLALEIVNDLAPAVTFGPIAHFPGTTSGATTTGWETNANSTSASDILAAVNDFAVDAYARNTAARSVNQPLDLLFRGSSSDQFGAGTRVVNVVLFVVARLANMSGNALGVAITGLLDLGGTRYVSPHAVVVSRNNKWGVYAFQWPLNPSTGLPWTRVEYNRLLDGTNDEFGVRVQGAIAAAGFHVAGFALVPAICVENRLGYYYDTGSPDSGWAQHDLTGTVAPVAGSWAWWIIYALNGSPGNYLRTGLVRAPGAVSASAPNVAGEHRRGHLVALTGPGGVVARDAQGRALATDLGAELAPVLLEASGTITAPSQPYVETSDVVVADQIGGVRLTGVSGSYISAPDHARLSPTGDITVEWLLALDDQTPSSTVTLLSKWGAAGQRSWRVRQSSTGALIWSWSPDGTSELTLTSSATVGSIGAADGYAAPRLRIRFDVDNGAGGRTAHFEYSFDRLTWAALGAPQTSAGTTSIFDSTAPVEIGSEDGGTAALAPGVAAAWAIYGDLAATDLRASVSLVADETFPETLTARLTDTAITDAQGNTWTLNGTLRFARYKVGQQITTAAATGYDRILVPVGWADPANRPDAALLIEIYPTWVAAIDGTAPLASARLSPEALTSGDIQDVPVDLGAEWTNTLNTQYVVVFSCPGRRGWRIPVADTRSHDRTSATTTQTEIEGAGVANGTDSHVTAGGMVWPRRDIHLGLATDPSSPSNGTAVVRAAA